MTANTAVCARFNMGKCRANSCRLRHVCSDCDGTHRANSSECPVSAGKVYSVRELLSACACCARPEVPMYQVAPVGSPVVYDSDEDCQQTSLFMQVTSILEAHGGTMRVAELCAAFIGKYETSLSAVDGRDIKPADRLVDLGFVLVGRGLIGVPGSKAQPQLRPGGLRPGGLRPGGDTKPSPKPLTKPSTAAKGRKPASIAPWLARDDIGGWLKQRGIASDEDTSAGEMSSSDSEGHSPKTAPVLKPANLKPSVAVKNMFFGLVDSDTKGTCCRRWNMGACKAVSCKFGHFCSDCDSVEADHQAGALVCPVAQSVAVRAGTLRLPPGLAL